jgi:Mu transposase, C-terminal
VDNGSAFVDAWLLRACAKLGIRLVHSTPHRPQGRRKIERFFRTVRDQFLVEVADTTAAELAEQQLTPAAALLNLNSKFTAWVESVYHHRIHSETGQTPITRWNDGWDALGHGPAMASAQALTEAFLWAAQRTVTKTATVSLHGNTYQVEPALVGRKVELVFSPFDLTRIEVRHHDHSYGLPCPSTSPATPTPRPDQKSPNPHRRHPPPPDRCRTTHRIPGCTHPSPTPPTSTSTPSAPTPSTTPNGRRSIGEYPASAGPLRVHEYALRAGSGPRDAAPPRRARRSRRPPELGDLECSRFY